MRVTIRLFAILRQQAGWRERQVELPADASVEEAWQALVGMHPEMESARPAIRFARNGAYASPADTLHDGDQLAVIPPVAGGAPARSGEHYRHCTLAPQRIEDEMLAELRRDVPSSADGALVMFVGQTRETPGTPAPGQETEAAKHAGKPVTGLDYEAFEEMAVTTLHHIADEIEARYDVRRLAIVHRVGRVAVSEPSIVIAAAAPHREAAFDACRYAIEELKARAPIWKSEHYADGTVWIGAPARENPVERGHDDPPPGD